MISHASVVPAQRSGDGVSEVAAVTAMERYKEIVGLAAESAERMREADRERVRDLLARLAASQDRVAELVEQEVLTRAGVRLLWEAAGEVLWEERWMQLSPVPRPDESVPPRDQREYLMAMDVAYQALEDTLQKRGLLWRKSS
ncbi:sulfur carrier protein ThiS [Saccharothrix tamanrassetensis]|uniref:Sulfur carrier protein ThiS n=1 Tax=Saccharothrix tamanrassetensis TaxID=1051531 RepID=A0A841CLM3_9PSEU|nr:hypothetical protein [Saccharothrix tamanrassetensis]MBB5956466.1 sulfur carrier protein ThiS [Saccharothrix tamanrassetensis]